MTQTDRNTLGTVVLVSPGAGALVRLHAGYYRDNPGLTAVLLARCHPGDLERALETYHQSLDMFTEMGAPGNIKMLEERLGDL